MGIASVDRLRADERGSVAVLFALLLLVIVSVIAIAVDMSRASAARTSLAGALDTATLTAARALADGPITEAQVDALVEATLYANLTGSSIPVVLEDVVATVDPVAGKVYTTATGQVVTQFPAIAKTALLKISAAASSTYESKLIELAMVLDVTGSMDGQKLTDLKKAATDLVNVLLPADGRNDARVRLSLVPFSAAVNAGTYASSVRATRSGGYGHTCVTERTSDSFLDSNPATSPLRGDTDLCPSARMLPLTNNRTSLTNRIESFVASGQTAGHLGVRWGWFTLSPNWTSVWPTASDPVAYDDHDTLKFIVFMTDGDFNKTYASGNGSSSAQASAICTTAKAAGVFIYSIAFSTASAPLSTAGENVMRGCATAPSYFFNARTGTELVQAFRTIAANVQALYLAS